MSEKCDQCGTEHAKLIETEDSPRHGKIRFTWTFCPNEFCRTENGISPDVYEEWGT